MLFGLPNHKGWCHNSLIHAGTQIGKLNLLFRDDCARGEPTTISSFNWLVLFHCAVACMSWNIMILATFSESKFFLPIWQYTNVSRLDFTSKSIFYALPIFENVEVTLFSMMVIYSGCSLHFWSVSILPWDDVYLHGHWSCKLWNIYDFVSSQTSENRSVTLVFGKYCVWVHYHITRTSEWVITLWRSCESFLHRDISRVRMTSEISLPKTMNMISIDDHHELVLVFMLYYFWLDIDFNGLCVQF